MNPPNKTPDYTIDVHRVDFNSRSKSSERSWPSEMQNPGTIGS